MGYFSRTFPAGFHKSRYLLWSEMDITPAYTVQQEKNRQRIHRRNLPLHSSPKRTEWNYIGVFIYILSNHRIHTIYIPDYLLC